MVQKYLFLSTFRAKNVQVEEAIGKIVSILSVITQEYVRNTAFCKQTCVGRWSKKGFFDECFSSVCYYGECFSAVFFFGEFISTKCFIVEFFSAVCFSSERFSAECFCADCFCADCFCADYCVVVSFLKHNQTNLFLFMFRVKKVHFEEENWSKKAKTGSKLSFMNQEYVRNGIVSFKIPFQL